MKKILLLFLTCMIFVSCTTTAYIDSVPTDLDLYSDGVYVGKTPQNVEIKNHLLKSSTSKIELKDESQQIIFSGDSLAKTSKLRVTADICVTLCTYFVGTPIWFFNTPSKPVEKQFILIDKNKIVNEEENNIYTKYPKDAEKIIAKKIAIGFNEEEVVMAWGKPDRILETKTDYFITKTYVYRGSNYSSQYVNFNNGIVESMNN